LGMTSLQIMLEDNEAGVTDSEVLMLEDNEAGVTDLEDTATPRTALNPGDNAFVITRQSCVDSSTSASAASIIPSSQSWGPSTCQYGSIGLSAVLTNLIGLSRLV
jgi:hypothetical protein